MKFTESQLESAIIELLGIEGYPHVLGAALGVWSSSSVVNDMDAAGATSLPGVLIKAPAINKHLKNIFDYGELAEEQVVSILETTTQHGAIAGKTQTQKVKQLTEEALA